ncbi:MAG: 2,3-bisphosphoglycerate-independent phosphoglycerate mutase [Methylococcaceae bacterium]|nr:2,3-bisphosphoglycerate-independent phosphoglycerate mutase [Methylococcaceae bacterium]
MKSDSIKPTVLLILDGFGCNASNKNNAIAMAHKPVWDSLWKNCPHTRLDCSGSVVGLPENQMGNSEVGHLHLGAGRLLPQDYTRIKAALENGEFQSNPVFCTAIDQAVSDGKAVHILGLLSPGGVHSHEDHIHAVTELCFQRGAEQVYVHGFLDGRDTLPKSAMASIGEMEAVFNKADRGRIASLIGRFYAMDRDSRWKRIEKAYSLIVQGKAERVCRSAMEALMQAYEHGETDEFVHPTAIVPEWEEPVRIEDGDVVIFMNFRADRVRQLVLAMTETDFRGFARERVPRLGRLVTLTSYHYGFNFPVAFPRDQVINCFGEYLSKLGIKQLRLAETEKYAHVTFFFNGGIEEPYPGESRLLVESPKVKTYDLKPEMSAYEVTDRLVEALREGHYGAIICNYANCDMVGHTGVIPAAVAAVETIDACLGRVTAAVKTARGQMLITADHGNAEQMFDPVSGQAATSHTLNPVPLVYFGGAGKLSDGGNLADVAPTLLELMGLKKPPEMTGRSLLEERRHAGNPVYHCI